MLTKRLIPVLLLYEGRMVKTKQFQNMRDVGSPITTAKVYDAQGVDELIFLDISASSEGRKTALSVVENVAKNCFMPLTIGGGISTLDDIRNALNAGADKVAINTAAFRNPNFIAESSSKFGCQCIVASIDVLKPKDGTYEVFTERGTQPTGVSPVVWTEYLTNLGAGEILLTSIDREGTMQGYDLELIKSVSGAVNIPVIANGGAGTLKHLAEAFEAGADAVAVSSLFHFTDQSPIKAKAYLKEAGILVRPI